MGLDKGFLDMLEGQVVWSPFLGEDLFGNEGYGDPETIAAYIGDFSDVLGGQDGNNKQEQQVVVEADLFTDAVGIGVKDKIEAGGLTFYASSVSTGRDETGEPLYHEVTLSTAPRG